jgi:hypothetical protein
MKYAEIIQQYSEGAITLEEVNANLKAAGATFHLADLTEEEREAKRQRENEAGFIYTDEKPQRLPERPDMSRKIDLAGQTVRQLTKAGTYEVSYDEDGYAKRAKRV